MTWLSRNMSKLGTDDWFTSSFSNKLNRNTPKCSLLYAGGLSSIMLLQHQGNGPSIDNLFTVHGPNRLMRLYGVVSDIGPGGVGVNDTMNNLKIELDNGIDQVKLTKLTNDLTGNGIPGTVLVKDREDSEKLNVLISDSIK
ncbi:unnamed protein product [marine sediment metagenome]|uniref:Uncharacterized protein n=1 Tax=marine sediment metagenome TaxID=412755 RepID=X1PUU3_9ZZZZ